MAVRIDPRERKDNIIEGKNISMLYNGVFVVDHIDIDVKYGEIYGFLGPNGAGKTTTIKMISTQIPATTGTIIVDGHDVKKEARAAKNIIGLVQQHISQDKDITVRENIIHKAMLYDVQKKVMEERMDKLCNVLGLRPYLDRTILSLSGGWRKRTAIACALIYKPKILFLDEPTTGLDTQSRFLLWTVIRELRDSGTTIFLTTHYIEEAMELCDRISMINKGRIVAEGTPQGLVEARGAFSVRYEHNGSCHVSVFKDRRSADEFVSTLDKKYKTTVKETDLEDLYLEMTGSKEEVDDESLDL